MVTINPHTTRATGTVLTAAIYNADHQNHVTNATTIDATAAYKNVSNTFTQGQVVPNIMITSTNGVHRDVNNSNLLLSGGSAGVGANIELYGSTHATTANDARFDADELIVRKADGTTGTSVTVQGDLTVTGTLTGAAAAFPSGTIMLFQQTAAPTAWTKLTTHNNKALRLTTGTVTTGGSVAFTTAFANQANTGTIGNTTATGSNSTTSVTIDNTTATGTVGGTAITEANLPSHTHGVGTLGGSTNTTGAHTHNITVTSNTSGATKPAGTDSGLENNYATSSAGNHSHTLTITGSTAATGSGTTHTHSFTGSAHSHTNTAHGHTFTGVAHNHTYTGNSINLAVQYVDVIMASKD